MNAVPHTTRQHRFEVLDGMRGVAAIMVMLHHLTPYTWLPNAFIAVDVFFLLSGFVLHVSYAQQLAAGMTVADYIGRRLIRLLPLCLAGIVSGIAAYAVVPARETELALALFPMNGPLWSLGLELIASLTFPWLIRIPTRGLVAFILVCFLTIAVVPFVLAAHNSTHAPDFNNGWATHNIRLGVPRLYFNFALGLLIGQLYQQGPEGWIWRTARRLAVGPMTIYLILIVVMTLHYYFKFMYYPLAVAIVAPTLIVLGITARAKTPALSRTSLFIGWLSYPLYCLHMPISHVLHAVIPWPAVMVIAAITSMSVAGMVAKYYDEPVRAWLSRHLSNSR